MANGDYGYFGKGDTGYAQYMTAFNRNFGGSSGGGGGGHRHVADETVDIVYREKQVRKCWYTGYGSPIAPG